MCDNSGSRSGFLYVPIYLADLTVYNIILYFMHVLHVGKYCDFVILESVSTFCYTYICDTNK